MGKKSFTEEDYEAYMDTLDSAIREGEQRVKELEKQKEIRNYSFEEWVEWQRGIIVDKPPRRKMDSSPDARKIRKYKRIYCIAFYYIEEKDQIIVANYFEKLYNKLVDGEDIGDLFVNIEIVRDLISKGYKDIDLDELIRFVLPKYEQVKDLFHTHHALDAQYNLVKDSVKEFLTLKQPNEK
jgi:hypothetical protein